MTSGRLCEESVEAFMEMSESHRTPIPTWKSVRLNSAVFCSRLTFLGDAVALGYGKIKSSDATESVGMFMGWYAPLLCSSIWFRLRSEATAAMSTFERHLLTGTYLDDLLLPKLLPSQDQRIWEQLILHFESTGTVQATFPESVRTFPSFSWSIASNFRTIAGLVYFLSGWVPGHWHPCSVPLDSISETEGLLRYQDVLRAGMGGACCLMLFCGLASIFCDSMLQPSKFVQYCSSRDLRSSLMFFKYKTVSSISKLSFSLSTNSASLGKNVGSLRPLRRKPNQRGLYKALIWFICDACSTCLQLGLPLNIRPLPCFILVATEFFTHTSNFLKCLQDVDE